MAWPWTVGNCGGCICPTPYLCGSKISEQKQTQNQPKIDLKENQQNQQNQTLTAIAKTNQSNQMTKANITQGTCWVNTLKII